MELPLLPFAAVVYYREHFFLFNRECFNSYKIVAIIKKVNDGYVEMAIVYDNRDIELLKKRTKIANRLLKRTMSIPIYDENNKTQQSWITKICLLKDNSIIYNLDSELL